MNLLIEASLSEPPSEVSCFRDVTLYAKTFIFDDVLLVCESGTRSFYWEWLKRHGAHDYISYLAKAEEDINGLSIHPKTGDFIVDRINSWTLNSIIDYLNRIKK